MSCRSWKCVSTAIFSRVGVWEGHRNYFKDQCSMNLQPIFLISMFLWLNKIAISSNVWKPNKTKSHNSLKLSFIWGLHSNFVGCEFFTESNSPDILALCQTNLEDSTDFGNFSMRDYLHLIQKETIGLFISSRNVASILITSMVSGLPDQLQIFWQMYLMECLGLLIGLGLLELWRFIYPRLLTGCGMVALFRNSNLMEF